MKNLGKPCKIRLSWKLHWSLKIENNFTHFFNNYNSTLKNINTVFHRNNSYFLGLSPMRHIRYRNKDKKAIKVLMREIGAYRYEMAIEQMKVEQRPISMEGFYLEANDDCIFLCHRYPSGIVLKLMKVEQFELLPREGGN